MLATVGNGMQGGRMKTLHQEIFTNAFNYSVSMTKFYVGLAKTNRDKLGVHAAQLRAAGVTLNRHAA
jgi:hypothetical protein